MKKKKLSVKIARIVSGMLAVIFLLFIGVVLVQTRLAVVKSTNEELKRLAEITAVQVEEILRPAEDVSQNISVYLEEHENELGQDSDESQTSVILPEVSLTEEQKMIEEYLTSLISYTAKNNEDIIGIGIYFEPDAFVKGVKDYSMYADSSQSEFFLEDEGDFASYSTEDYYRLAADSKQTVYTSPYYDDTLGMTVISLSRPILIKDSVKGVILVDFTIDKFGSVDLTTAKEQFPSLYYDIATGDGTIIYSGKQGEDEEDNITDAFSNEKQKQELLAHISDSTSFIMNGKDTLGKNLYHYGAPVTTEVGNWVVINTITSKDVNHSVMTTMYTLLILSIIAIIVIIMAVIFVLKKMLDPIQQLVYAANAISEGNLDISVEVTSNDEIGMLAEAFDKTASYLKRMIGEISYLLSQMADNKLNVDLEEEYLGDFSAIETSFKLIIENLNQTLTHISASAEQFSMGSSNVSLGAQELSQGITEQTDAVEELAEMMKRFSQQLQKTVSIAEQTNIDVKQVGLDLTQSNKQMHEMIDAMSKINTSSREIEKIIKTIDDIAFQTNILALNASVEAARAGASGKGFSVVAEEVRNLANKSAVAAKQTAVLIESSIKAVNNGTAIADETAASLLRVVEGTEKITEKINTISDASHVQAESVEHMKEEISQITTVIRTNSAVAEESAATSEELSSQAQMLKDTISVFQMKK